MTVVDPVVRRSIRTVVVTCLRLYPIVGLSSVSMAGPQPARLPSSVFRPDNHKLFPLPIPNSREVIVPGGRVYIAELRGWLRSVPTTCDPKDGTWYYLLEVDPRWADSAGISLADILEVGNITGLVDYPESNPPEMVVGLPLIRIEIPAWNVRREYRRATPAGWSFAGHGDCLGYRYQSDPLWPAPSGSELKIGSYVRIVGSIVSDSPHATKAAFGAWIVQTFGVSMASEHRIYAAQNIWSEGAEEDPRNPARWTEIHPADEIDLLLPRAPAESVIGVAVALGPHLLSWAADSFVLWMSPPAARPSWARGVRVIEVPLAASPKDARCGGVSGSRVSVDRGKVRIRIDLRAAQLDKFAAVFRASWSAQVSTWTVRCPRPR